MVNTPPSKSPQELIEALDQIESDDYLDLSPSGISSASARSMVDKLGSVYRVLNARFSGDLPRAHEIGVGPATSVLGELQGALSEIGASLTQSVPLRGPLPATVVAATELVFSPHIASGSVVFTLLPVQHDGELWSDESPSLLDQSLSKLFEVFAVVEQPVTSGTTSDTVPALLTEFGPRTARHLFNFANALSSGGLSLDLGWLRSGGRDTRSRLSKGGASYLGEMAKKATSRDNDVVLRGEVTKLGKDNKHRFKDDELGNIPLTTTPELSEELYQMYNSRVEISAVETEKINIATGVSTRTYKAVVIQPLASDEASTSDSSSRTV